MEKGNWGISHAPGGGALVGGPPLPREEGRQGQAQCDCEGGSVAMPVPGFMNQLYEHEMSNNSTQFFLFYMKEVPSIKLISSEGPSSSWKEHCGV